MTLAVSRYGSLWPTIGLVIAPIAAVLITIQISAPGIPPKTVNHAESIAAFILARAGVSVRWSGQGAYQVQITNSSLRNLSADAAGFAVLTPGDSGYAAIGYPAVEETANSLEADPGDLLGAALAHEVGHLLLGPAHTATGIMRAHFGLREIQLAGRGELLFSADQAARLREKMRSKATSIPIHAEFHP
jgi:hypothetical protein